jgi:hypothetical protein
LTTVLDGTLGKVPGSFGSATEVPVLAVDAKGRVIGISKANVASTLSIAGTSGSSGTVNLLNDTLTIAAGTGVTTTFNDSTNTLSIGLSGSPSFTDLTLTGNITGATSISSSGNITAGGNLAAVDLNLSGNAIIAGNLTVNGTVTTVSSTTVTIADRSLQLAPAANSAVLTDGGGLLVGVNGPGGFIAPSLIYTQSNDRWNLNKDLAVANVYGALKGNADTASAWSASRTISFATGDVSGSFATDGQANVSNVALTLATQSGLTATSYGDSVTVPSFTVNAKGLITAASSTAIPNATISVKGLASFDSSQFTVTAGAVTISTVDGGSY